MEPYIPFVKIWWTIFIFITFMVPNVIAKVHKQNLLNYGLIFEKEGHVNFGKDVWMHTFQIKLPIKTKGTKIVKCKDKDFCQEFNAMIDQLNEIHRETIFHLNDTVNIIKDVMPTSAQMKNGKRNSKRAILSFVGQLSKTFFWDCDHGRCKYSC